MNCTKCGKATRVINSRPVKRNGVRRRRLCMTCEHRFTTVEVVDEQSAEDRVAELKDALKKTIDRWAAK